MNQNPDVPSGRNQASHELYGQGCTYLEAQDYPNAISALKQAIQYWQEDGQAWLALGQCYIEDNKPRRAEKCFRQTLEYATAQTREAANRGLESSLGMQQE